MKLARFEFGGRIDLGVVKDGGLIGLHEVGFGYSDMHALIAAGSEVLDDIRQRTANAQIRHAIADVHLLAPLRPGKYLAIGMNYAKHVAEMGRTERPKYQYWFNKQTTCINGPFDPIEPGVTEMLDYEVELGVVIGRAAKGVKAGQALDHVFGYLVANDVSARDWQRHSPTFTMGKSFDTHGPIGPWIVTADEIPDPQALGLRCLVNGEVRQQSTTADMRPRPPPSTAPRVVIPPQKIDIASTGKLALAATAATSPTMNATFTCSNRIDSAIAIPDNPIVAAREMRISSRSSGLPRAHICAYRSCEIVVAPASVSPATTARIVANVTAAMKP